MRSGVFGALRWLEAGKVSHMHHTAGVLVPGTPHTCWVYPSRVSPHVLEQGVREAGVQAACGLPRLCVMGYRCCVCIFHASHISTIRFIYLKERKTDLPTSDSFCKGLDQVKARGPELHPWSPTCGCKGPRTWAIFHCCPRCISIGTSWKLEQPGPELGLTRDSRVATGGLARSAT